VRYYGIKIPQILRLSFFRVFNLHVLFWTELCLKSEEKNCPKFGDKNLSEI
jgi:hypothetical protein